MTAPLLQATRHCLREARDGLLRHPALTLLAVLSIAVSLYVFGLFALFAFNLSRLARGLGQELQVQIYLDASASPEDIRALRETLMTDPAVKEVRYVTPDEARRRFDAQFPGLKEVTGAIGGEIFPPSFEVIPRPAYRDAAAAESLARGFRLAPGVQEVRYDRDWFERLKSLIALMRGGGYGVGTLLLLAVMVTVGTVVRLTVLARREEIEIMKLVGATAAFIRGPFLIGAAAQGLLGGLLAAGGLALSWRLFIDSQVFRENAFMALVAGTFLPASGLAGLAVAGMILGLLAAALSLHRAASV